MTLCGFDSDLWTFRLVMVVFVFAKLWVCLDCWFLFGLMVIWLCWRVWVWYLVAGWLVLRVARPGVFGLANGVLC